MSSFVTAFFVVAICLFTVDGVVALPPDHGRRVRSIGLAFLAAALLFAHVWPA